MLPATAPLVAASPALARDPRIDAVLHMAQPGAVRFYPVDATVYAQGDRAGQLYLVEFGAVRICG